MGLLERIYSYLNRAEPTPVSGGAGFDFVEVREGGKVVRRERAGHLEAYYLSLIHI